jgi:hypothetical protein
MVHSDKMHLRTSFEWIFSTGTLSQAPAKGGASCHHVTFLTARLIVWPFPEFIPAFLFDPLLMLAAAHRFLI